MEWKDVWKEEPPRNTEIFFVTGNEKVHVGQVFSDEKLRKCSFYSYLDKPNYGCDSDINLEYRVIYWLPIPVLNNL